MRGPRFALVEAEHEAARRLAVAAREDAVAQEHELGHDVAFFQLHGFRPRLACVVGEHLLEAEIALPRMTAVISVSLSRATASFPPGPMVDW